MKTIALQIFILILSMHVTFAQQQQSIEIKDFQDRLLKIEASNNNLKNELTKQKSDFLKRINDASDSIKILQTKLQNNEANIQTISKDLGIKISDTKATTENKIQGVQDNISSSTRYWIIAVIGIAILSFFLFWILRKQLSKEKTDIAAKIQQTKKILEEESIKLDNKLVDLLDKQMKVLNEERKNTTKEEELDHTLALKVADEIVRIEKNLKRLEGNEKEIKPILKGLERIRDNFAASGYEMVQLLNIDYDDRMNVDVINFINDENIPKGKRIITKVIRPQVNYQGVLKQKAQVDVSQN